MYAILLYELWIIFQKLYSQFFFPNLIGMKVYITDEKELIMEPSLKWAGNPNVTLTVKAFGLKPTVQVVCFPYCYRKWFTNVIHSLTRSSTITGYRVANILNYLKCFRWWICKSLLHLELP